MKQPRDWTDQQIKYYYEGIKHSDYPRLFWQKMQPFMEGARTLTDIGCGPGAFALEAAAAGFQVQAVDINGKNLRALAGQAEARGLANIELIHGDWLEVTVAESEVTVCAYSFGGNIGTRAGIEKLLATTRELAFLISPCEKVRTDFLSAELYQKMGIAPRTFSGDHREILQIFSELQQQVEFEIVAYDFGMPLASKDEIKSCAVYLSDKLELPDVQLVEAHIRDILTVKDGLYWLPNPKKSAFIIWQRSEKDE
ncbi:MAG: methyltransferase domain-containing protein [Clostridia bacterium]|nr:methyltransferase domain-containing protein [Clostridia bacterium]